MTLSHSAQSGQHRHVERGADLYETPACATEALLRVEQLPHWIWEPAAGRGAIVNVLRDHGHAAIASDIIDYGFPLHFVGDFLDAGEGAGRRRVHSDESAVPDHRRVRRACARSVPARDHACARLPFWNRSAARAFSNTAGSRACMFSATASR